MGVNRVGPFGVATKCDCHIRPSRHDSIIPTHATASHNFPMKVKFSETEGKLYIYSEQLPIFFRCRAHPACWASEMNNRRLTGPQRACGEGEVDAATFSSAYSHDDPLGGLISGGFNRICITSTDLSNPNLMPLSG